MKIYVSEREREKERERERELEYDILDFVLQKASSVT